jgi:hypothetical protein
MAPVRNARIIMAEFLPGKNSWCRISVHLTLFCVVILDSYQPGKSTVYDVSQRIDIDTVPLNGGILLKTLFLGIDPYILARMRPKSPSWPVCSWSPLIDVLIDTEPSDWLHSGRTVRFYACLTSFIYINSLLESWDLASQSSWDQITLWSRSEITSTVIWVRTYVDLQQSSIDPIPLF